MSLVVTALRREFAIQLSDMRLTCVTTQAVCSEIQRKAIALQTRDAWLAVGWSGFASDRHNRHNTGDWLVDQLTRLSSISPLPEFAARLAGAATERFRTIAEPLDHKACSIVMAGWASTGPNLTVPLAVLVSNCEDRKWQRLPHARTAFDTAWLMPSTRWRVRTPCMVIISGTEQATSRELGSALRRLLLREESTPAEVLNGCIRLMKDATSHPTYGDLIGRNWVGLEMHHDSPEARAHYFPEKKSPEEFMPNLVTPTITVKDATIWTGPGEPPWWNK